jgi:Flp pilus assembly protein TadG
MMLSRFLKDHRGSSIPLLALAVIPIMGAVGAAVDYSRANNIRTGMQNALDSAALMLSKDAPDMTTGDLTTKANDYFNAMFTSKVAQDVNVTTTLSSPQEGNFILDIKGTATVPTTFAKVIGTSQIAISASTEVKWGIKKLELALVLDNTGSMGSSGKMDALKAAAHNLLTTLKNAAKKDGDIKVSIIPFVTDVNVGTGYVSADWIDWADWETKNGSCSSYYYSSQSSCTSHGYVWTAASHSTWNGCVWDRDQNNDVLNTAPVAGTTATMFPAHQAPACPASMMSLSYDWTALNNKIDAMAPSGNTNITIGLAWGLQTLSTVGPFNTAAPPADDLDKVIVLLTDGDNTQNRWTSSSSSIDTRTSTVCDNIKAANIKIYTVRVINGNAALLQNCATKPDMYYDVQQANQLDNVFSSIADNLAKLRLAK